MAKHGTNHVNESNREIRKRQDQLDDRTNSMDDHEEKLQSLKLINSLLVKETLDRRKQADSLIRAKDAVETESTRFKAELRKMSEHLVGLEMEKRVVYAYVRAQMAQLESERDVEIGALKEEVSKLEIDLRNERDQLRGVCEERDVLKIDSGRLSEEANYELRMENDRVVSEKAESKKESQDRSARVKLESNEIPGEKLNLNANKGGSVMPRQDAARSMEQGASKSVNKEGQRLSAVESGKDSENVPADEGRILSEKGLFPSRVSRSVKTLKGYKSLVPSRNIALPEPSRDQPNGCTAVKQKGGTSTTDGYAIVSDSQLSGGNSYNSQQHQTFLTSCPFCKIKYRCLQCHVNKLLRCQKCARNFNAVELSNHIALPASPQSHVPQLKVLSKPGPSKFDALSKPGSDKKCQDRFAGVNRISLKIYASEEKSNAEAGKKQKVQCENVKPDQGSNVKPGSDIASGSNLSAIAMKKHKAQHVNVKDNQVGILKPKSDAAKSMQEGASKNENKKRQRESDVRPGEDSENSQEDEGNILSEKYPILSRDNSHRRYVRCKNDASYQRDLSVNDDGFVVSLNKDSLNVMRDGSNMSDPNKVKSKDADIYADEKDVVCADPDLSNCDRDKAENCFAVNQIWAIHDDADAMPRYYARIERVFSTESKLQITWFDPDPADSDERNWYDAALPVACGKFKLGYSEETADFSMFSHLIHSLKQVSKGVYMMYPQKGETWALFKNWDIRWSYDVEGASFDYEYVEILSDFVEGVGILVCYLVVDPLTRLFRKTKKQGVKSFEIPAYELYRFSHQIPPYVKDLNDVKMET